MVKRKYQDPEQENTSITDGVAVKEARLDNTGGKSTKAPVRDPMSLLSGSRVNEHNSESTTRTVAKKAKGKGKSGTTENKLATRRRNSKIGVLESLMSMPFDIVCEIAINMSPVDLLSMARSSKALRAYFTTKQSKSIWRAAREGVGLPECPADVSEMKFADLIFCKGCYNCGAPRADMLSLPCRLRLCRPCFSKSFATKIIMQTTFKFCDWLFPFLSISVFDRFGGEYYNINEAKEVQKQYQSLCLKEVAAFIAEKNQTVSDIMQNTKLVKVWMSIQQQRKNDEKKAIIYHRFCKLLDNNYSYKDFEDYHDTKEMCKEWNKLLREPKTLTDRIWNNIKPKLERIILLRRSIRREFMISLGHASDCECSDSEYFECDDDHSDCDCEHCLNFL